jgi:hypothetical protein
LHLDITLLELCGSFFEKPSISVQENADKINFIVKEIGVDIWGRKPRRLSAILSNGPVRISCVS